VKSIFLGDKFDDEEMLDWLTDPNVMEVNDQVTMTMKPFFFVTEEKLPKAFFSA
jgi:hypothetical protein